MIMLQVTADEQGKLGGKSLEPAEWESLKAMTYEEAIQNLEQVVARLESGEISLDESMALFRRGIALSEICAGKLAAIEKQITQLIEKPDGQTEEKPFGEES
jgi:exodeoxyribonuclease VII small subunit